MQVSGYLQRSQDYFDIADNDDDSDADAVASFFLCLYLYDFPTVSFDLVNFFTLFAIFSLSLLITMIIAVITMIPVVIVSAALRGCQSELLPDDNYIRDEPGEPKDSKIR